MRSRYTAFVRREIAYLVSTHDASTRGAVDVRAIEQWSRETTWQGLEIVDVVRGDESDVEGVVEFIARGVTRGTPFAQRERSRFRRVDGQWFYLDGEISAAPPNRGRNRGR